MTGQLTGHISVGVTVKIASNGGGKNTCLHETNCRKAKKHKIRPFFLTYFYRISTQYSATELDK